MRSNQRLRMGARSLAVFADQAGSARLAASMARAASSAPRFGTVATSAPVAGSKTEKVLLDVIHWPSIRAALGNFLAIMLNANSIALCRNTQTRSSMSHATREYQR